MSAPLCDYERSVWIRGCCNTIDPSLRPSVSRFRGRPPDFYGMRERERERPVIAACAHKARTRRPSPPSSSPPPPQTPWERPFATRAPSSAADGRTGRREREPERAAWRGAITAAVCIKSSSTMDSSRYRRVRHRRVPPPSARLPLARCSRYGEGEITLSSTRGVGICARAMHIRRFLERFCLNNAHTPLLMSRLFSSARSRAIPEI